MGNIAIRVAGLSKQYRIGAKQEDYKTFRDLLTDTIAAPFKRVGGLLRGNAAAAANLNETIWALKDVSFEVKKGEVVGIIGRNGAGKSTLLKILSRITEPTEGEARVYGRVGALLEVGTGFHPELTGRENVYLNAAILGMSRAEINRKFDEIVAFAEIERFIDTPVKHYSSGMGLRLGFAVAAHLEPEILIVDEVLAVGDIAFQKKCLGKMGEVAGEGRTVLLVSHNMLAVSQLCKLCVWLDAGQVKQIGETNAVIRDYSQSSTPVDSFDIHSVHRVGTGKARFTSVRLVNPQGEDSHISYMGSPLTVELVIESREVRALQIALIINDKYDRTLVHSVSEDDHLEANAIDGTFRVRVVFPNLQLYPGEFTLGVWCGYLNEDYDYIFNCLPFRVEENKVSGRTSRMVYGKAVFFMSAYWSEMRENVKSPTK